MAKLIEIFCSTDGFRRGGIAHPAGKTVYEESRFTKVQIEQLKKEKKLSVRFYEGEPAEEKPEETPDDKTPPKKPQSRTGGK